MVNYINQLKDLPQFTILSLSVEKKDVCLIGSFNRIDGVDEYRSWLMNEKNCFIGDLEKLNPQQKTAVFITPEQEAKNIIKGHQFAWINGCWQPRLIRRILDDNNHWIKKIFKPTDAQEFIQHNIKNRTDIRGWTKIDNQIPRNAQSTKIISGGWDHEHCEICTSRIGVGGELIGYKDEANIWLCEKCYSMYALHNDLSFLQRH